MIPFNRPAVTGDELYYIEQALKVEKLSGDGEFTKSCHRLLEERFHCPKALLTTSCTHALEMAAILAEVGPGDEVIMPSYTFVSTANAFVLRGANVVFVDIRPDTMNVDETLVEAAITERTKAIVVVHYAGVACEMDTIMDIAEKYNLLVVEDAAQGVMSTYKGTALGTIGHLGCYSFHETKNVTCGEGGALMINDARFVERAEFIREKGTNRSKFYRGEIDKYTWVDIGSSYLPSELNAAYLYAQLRQADAITDDRLSSWHAYYRLLKPLAEAGHIELPVVPEGCTHNAHMFFVKARDEAERSQLMAWMKEHGVVGVFHYVPLHSTAIGSRLGRFHGVDRYTTTESERLVRLPLYYGLKQEHIREVADVVWRFYEK